MFFALQYVYISEIKQCLILCIPTQYDWVCVFCFVLGPILYFLGVFLLCDLRRIALKSKTVKKCPRLQIFNHESVEALFMLRHLIHRIHYVDARLG